MRFQRINVVGSPGSGKTTFARRLAEKLGLPFYEIDELFWKSGWRESSDQELFARIEEVTRQPGWVLDGNYTRTIPIKWSHVQQVIWLDPSFLRTIYQVGVRTIRRSFTREELWPRTGNRESLLQAFFSPKSIIWIAMRQHPRKRAQYGAFMTAAEYAHISFVRLRSDAEAARFLEAA